MGYFNSKIVISAFFSCGVGVKAAEPDGQLRLGVHWGGIDRITGSEVSVEAIRHLHEHFRPKLIKKWLSEKRISR